MEPGIMTCWRRMSIAGSLVAAFAAADGLACSRECRIPGLWPFDRKSPWNVPIGSNAVYGDAENLITKDVLLTGVNFNTRNWSISVIHASRQGPERLVSLADGSVISVRFPPNFVIPGGSDAQVTVVEADGLRSRDFFGFAKAESSNYRARFMLNGPMQDLRGTGVPDFETSGHDCVFWGGSRAYGGNAQAGLVRKWELETAKAVGHVIAMAFAGSQLSNSKIVWPAGCHDTDWQTNTGHIAYGQLLAIPQSIDVTKIGLSDYGAVLAYALQKYGAYVVDRSSNGVIYGEPTIESGIAQRVSEDLPMIVKELRPVLNNAISSVGGGGSPLAPYAPELCDEGQKDISPEDTAN